MKKSIKIMVVVVLSIILTYTIILKLCPENKDFSIVLESIVLEDLSDSVIDNLNNYGDFYYQSMSEKDISTVINNPKRFKIASLKFFLYNSSKEIIMEDISINHKFTSEIKERVVVYNNKNGDISLFCFQKDI